MVTNVNKLATNNFKNFRIPVGLLCNYSLLSLMLIDQVMFFFFNLNKQVSLDF